ncbi:MAG TPA: YdeI/OmpD-associated family protein [Candidatus Dormibacteraeota bacterium]
MPTPENVIFFARPAELRAWFDANHETATDLWLGYHKKRSGRPSVTWPDVVDQALCFGWIDSVRYSLGDDRSAQRITPRRKRSVWSAVNIRRFAELDKLGLVHPSGRAAFEARDEARSRIYAYENRSAGLDRAREAEFRRHKAAWKFFESQAPWYRRNAVYWVMSAKREETRERRLKTLIERSAGGERIGPLTRPSPRSL